MQSIDLATLNTQVLWATFSLSVIFGAITQRSHFCTMGAVSDIVNMGDWTRMRQWAFAIGVAMIGFGSLVYAGLVDPSRVIYASTRWIWFSATVGGLLFGFGMVLASGCGSKTLVRIGGGSLKSLVVLLVMGLSAFATLKGITAVLRVTYMDPVAVDFSTGTSLPQWATAWFGMEPALASLVLGVVLGGLLLVWALMGSEFRRGSNIVPGLLIGGVVVAMWWVTGSLGFVPEHPETLEEVFVATSTGRVEALSFVAPTAYTLEWLMFFSDKNRVLTTGVVSVMGVVVGSWLCALFFKTFRWESFGGTEDLANHLLGALMMGVGGVTAMGCTVGQGLSGISTLNATSFVAVAAIIAGAVGGLRYQVWRLDRLL
jgi:uncharacterized membrane protein YedE/YeeE